MKHFIGFLLRDKHRIPPMSLAEMLGLGLTTIIVLFLVFAAVFM